MGINLPTTIFPVRRHPRLSVHDYSHGTYFVTICTYRKMCLFGAVENGCMRLNNLGELVQTHWQNLPDHYPEVDNALFVVMPNHVHGIIGIGAAAERSRAEPDPFPRSLPEIVGSFKSHSARTINQIRGTSGTPMWQRSFYEHMIRSEEEFRLIGEYILYNPGKWETDPDRTP